MRVHIWAARANTDSMIVMTIENASHDDVGGSGVDPRPSVAERIGSDWWAVIVVGVLAALAVVDLLPKIPW